MTSAKILILDDSPIVREHAKRTLEAAGHVVLVASSFVDANHFYFHEKPQLILIDVNLGPLITGDKVVEVYRNRRTASYAPLLILYSDSDASSLREITQRCGADSWLRKGGDLAAQIAELLSEDQSKTATG